MIAKAKRPSPILSAASALIGDASDALVTRVSRFRHSFEVSVTAVNPDPEQPRKVFSEAEIESLAATMAEQGQLQPILVRPSDSGRGQWIIVAGERRWRAAHHNQWPTILAIEHDGDPEVLSLIENLQRVDLNPIEEARGIQRLIHGKSWTQDQAAEALGKPKSEISGVLRMLTLPAHILDEVQTSELDVSKSVLMEWARLDQPSAHAQLERMAREGRLTVRAIRAIRDSGRATAASSGDIASANISGRSTSEVGLKAFTKAIQAAKGVREARAALTSKQRAALEALRSEIDQLLCGRGEDDPPNNDE